MQSLIQIAGIGQLALIIASLAIPGVLRWREETAKLRPLTRQVFWTYAGYIWATNLSFGLISTFASDTLLDKSSLALYVTLFIALYWSARLIIQFTYFDRSDAPQGAIFKLAETLLVGLFVFLTGVYGYAAVLNSGLMQ